MLVETWVRTTLESDWIAPLDGGANVDGMDEGQFTSVVLDLCCRLGWYMADGLYSMGLSAMGMPLGYEHHAAVPRRWLAAPTLTLTGPVDAHPERVCGTTPPTPEE
jgi:hypothetical protein